MERKAAFTPRIRRGEQGEKGEKGEKIEGPLQELAQDKAEVEGYNFALRAVLNREVPSSAVLRALAEPFFSNGYLVDRFGNYVSISRLGDPHIRREEILGKRLPIELVNRFLLVTRLLSGGRVTRLIPLLNTLEVCSKEIILECETSQRSM
ncbi:hypothetical protein EBT31_03195 [bacterium]|nr:hypothetical protein [bacterium]NBX51063.1 hypothetical protein [bacterium]